MNKTSNPVMKDGLGIVVRLVVIAALLSILGTFLQGCSGKDEKNASYSQHQALDASCPVAPQEPSFYILSA